MGGWLRWECRGPAIPAIPARGQAGRAGRDSHKGPPRFPQETNGVNKKTKRFVSTTRERVRLLGSGCPLVGCRAVSSRRSGKPGDLTKGASDSHKGPGRVGGPRFPQETTAIPARGRRSAKPRRFVTVARERVRLLGSGPPTLPCPLVGLRAVSCWPASPTSGPRDARKRPTVSKVVAFCDNDPCACPLAGLRVSACGFSGRLLLVCGVSGYLLGDRLRIHPIS